MRRISIWSKKRQEEMSQYSGSIWKEEWLTSCVLPSLVFSLVWSGRCGSPILQIMNLRFQIVVFHLGCILESHIKLTITYKILIKSLMLRTSEVPSIRNLEALKWAPKDRQTPGHWWFAQGHTARRDRPNLKSKSGTFSILP